LKHRLIQFTLFSAIGLVGTAAHFFLLILLVQGIGVNPVFASIAGFVLGALVNYWLNYHITFQSKTSHYSSLPRYMTVALIGLGLNTFIMAKAVVLFHYLLSQLLATGLVLIWNFLCSCYWTFRGEIHADS
jgi:putative flippase GtrA